jgi:hypothetical protein
LLTSKPEPMAGETPTSAPASNAQISPAVPSDDFTRSESSLVFAEEEDETSAGADAIARNAGLPSSDVRIWTNCPGVTYPSATLASTEITMDRSPPLGVAASLETIDAVPHSKSFHPAVVRT